MLSKEITDKVIAYIQDYHGNSSFFLSVQTQLRDRGSLSERQIAKIHEILEQKPTPAVAPVAAADFKPSYNNGVILELRSFIAKKLQEEFQLQHTFRNVEVLETLRETEKAIQVRLKLSPRYSTRCCVCGLPLDTEISRATGIGPVCAKNWGISRYGSNAAHEVIKELESRLEKVMTDRPFWIPRSQIRSVL